MLSPDETASTLIAAGVATVHEAQGRRGLVDRVRLISGPGFAGPAVTVSIPAGDNLGVHIALERPRPGSVLCVASHGRGIFGVVGELIVEASRAAGLAGLVIDDGVRDVSQFSSPPSVAAVRVCLRGSVKRRWLSLNEPVALGGTIISPGDWVVGDADGVCVIPSHMVDTVIAASKSRLAKEETIRKRLRGGEPTLHVLGLGKMLNGDSTT